MRLWYSSNAAEPAAASTEVLADPLPLTFGGLLDSVQGQARAMFRAELDQAINSAITKGLVALAALGLAFILVNTGLRLLLPELAACG